MLMLLMMTFFLFTCDFNYNDYYYFITSIIMITNTIFSITISLLTITIIMMRSLLNKGAYISNIINIITIITINYLCN